MFGFSNGGAATSGGFNNIHFSFHPTDFGGGGIRTGNFEFGGVTQSGDAEGKGSATSQSFSWTPPTPKSDPSSGPQSAGTATGGLLQNLAVYGYRDFRPVVGSTHPMPVQQGLPRAIPLLIL